MFSPNCLPVLIGSLPLKNHQEAAELIFQYTPEIPLWPQLPAFGKEGMVRQFISGFPGLIDDGKRYWVDSSANDFPEQMTSFYEHFFACESLLSVPDSSLFALTPDTARGFFTFIDMLANSRYSPITLKGQITGPITTGISIRDQNGRALFYNDNLRDMLVKLLCGKARWQVEQMKPFCVSVPPIIFIDEPGMVSFGSTAFAGVSRELVSSSVSELINTIKAAGGLAGIHICANGDWAPALDSDADIISFDSYSYFDHFVLYRDQLVSFLERGGILAWGIVPTGNPEVVKEEGVEHLFTTWQGQLKTLCSLGFSEQQIFSQTIISPACGTGSLSPELAVKVLSMTKELSALIRKAFAPILPADSNADN